MTCCCGNKEITGRIGETFTSEVSCLAGEGGTIDASLTEVTKVAEDPNIKDGAALDNGVVEMVVVVLDADATATGSSTKDGVDISIECCAGWVFANGCSLTGD